jgi:hypothetical protein
MARRILPDSHETVEVGHARRITRLADCLGAAWRLPARLLPYLDPRRAPAELSRRFPSLGITEFRADRIDPDNGVVTLQGTLRVVDRSRTGPRFASIRAAADGDETVWISPTDPALPNLPAVLEHPFVEHAMCAPGRREGSPQSRILAHRFGRHACFRVELSSSSFLGRVYARRGDGTLVYVLGLLASQRERIRALVPQVMFHDPERRFVALTWIDGASLHERLRVPPLVGTAAAGAAVRAWQSVPVEGLARHGAREELETIRRLTGRVAAVRPALASELEAEIAAQAAAASSRRDGPPVLAHRDLHDKHVLLGSSGVGVIDWDLAAAGPSALDPGNFLAHLRLRVLQKRLPPWSARALRRAFLAGYAAKGGGVPEDLARWETLALLRLAAVYALRPGWPDLSESLLGVVQRSGA